MSKVCKACQGTGVSSKGTPCRPPCKGKGTAFAGYMPSEERPAVLSLFDLEVGDRFGLTDGTGRAGVLEHNSASTARVKLEDGKRYNWTPSVECVKLAPGDPVPHFPLPQWLGQTVPSATTPTQTQEQDEEPARSEPMSPETTTAEEPKVSKKASRKKTTKKSAKKKVSKKTKATKAKGRRAAQNGVSEAQLAVLRVLKDGKQRDRAFLKAKVEHSNYTKLMRDLEEAGLVLEGDEGGVKKKYEITAAGRKAISK